jgi:two-component system, cell cycle sensor histidine kinase and response regulator CckA
MAEETILLVEDDDMIRAFVCSVLQGHGYRVLPADNGMDALYVVNRVGARAIDLVLTDVDMPALDGVGLARSLRQLRPDLRILYMTGCPGRLSDELQGGSGVIAKPFAYATLVRRVSACLSAAERQLAPL